MNKRGTVILIMCVVAVAGSWGAWKSWRAEQILNALKEVVHSADIDKLLHDNTQNMAESVDLAIKGIHLVQGENGEETWRLDAQWATLRQNSGFIDVREPDVRYVLSREDKPAPATDTLAQAAGEMDRERYLFVTAAQGQVSENNNRLDLNGNVISIRGEDVLTGPEVYYTEQNRTLVYPSGANIAGPTLNGDAGVLKWNLDTNILNTENGINLEWKTPKKSLNPAADPGSES